MEFLVVEGYICILNYEWFNSHWIAELVELMIFIDLNRRSFVLISIRISIQTLTE